MDAKPDPPSPNAPTGPKAVADGSSALRILVASAVRLYRDGLAQALGHHGHVAVATLSSAPEDALSHIAALAPDVVLVDIAMPLGLALAGAIGTSFPGCIVIAVGMAEPVEVILACVQAGVRAYVPRDASIDDLLRILLAAFRGEVSYPPAIADALLVHMARGADHRRRAAGSPRLLLTAREREVIALVDQGLSNRDIARRLAIGVPTVKTHIHHILAKLSVHRRGEAAAMLRTSLGAAAAS